MALPAGYRLREVVAADAVLITSHRHRMFVEAGHAPGKIEKVSERFLPWVQVRLASRDYFGWLVLHGEEVCAGLGMLWLEWPPHHLDLGTRRGYILNVYTEHAHRRRGLSRALMQVALEHARQHGARVTGLHATSEGKPLYESLGFAGTSEMFYLNPAIAGPD